MNLYKWLWSRIGGRPWTYIMRDARQKYPTPWMLGVMVVSATVSHFYWGKELLVWFGILLLGILWGHLWWGSKIVMGQGE